MAPTKPRPVNGTRRPADDIDTIGGDNVVWEELNGALLAIHPISVERGIRTQHGEREAVFGHVLVCDGDLAGTTYRETLIFPGTLVGQLKRRPMNRPVLVRLGQGEPQRDEYGDVMVDPQTGEEYSAPWKFLACTDEDKEVYFRLRDGRPVKLAQAAPKTSAKADTSKVS